MEEGQKGTEMIALPSDGGGGFAVNAQSLRGFAQRAEAIGQSVEELALQAHAALAAGASGGLDIGAAIARAESAWNARLRQLASEASRISTSLVANVGSYDQAETAAHDAFTRILRGGGLAL